MVISNQRRDDSHSNHRVDENIKSDMAFQVVFSGACGQTDKPKPVGFQLLSVAVSLVNSGIVGCDISIFGNGVDENIRVNIISMIWAPGAVRQTSLLQFELQLPSNRRSLRRTSGRSAYQCILLQHAGTSTKQNYNVI